MATLRWYLVNGVDANGWQQLSETAQGVATCNAGWVVGTGLTNNSELQANTERASTTFTGTTVPDGTLDTTLKDAFRTPALNGTFASANWTFQFAVVSTVQSGAADGQIVFRLIKANADGSSATEITSAQQSASVMTNVAGTDINGTLTFNPGAITLTAGQYLFVQVAWKRTGAGGMTTTNIRLRTGSSTTVGTTILSSDFTPGDYAVTGATIASTAAVNPLFVDQFLLSRIQSTGKVKAATVPSLAITFASPPTVGNGIVVMINGWSTAASMVFSTTACVDNQGNTYTRVQTRTLTNNPEFGTAIYFCPSVATTGAPFTITVTGTIAGHYFVGTALEIGGNGAFPWGVIASLTNAVNASTAPTSGVTAAVGAGEAFVAGCFQRTNAPVSITTESVTPPWASSFNELDGTNSICGAGDTRILNLSGTTSISWTTGAAGNYAAAIAVFRPAAPQSVTGNMIASGVIVRVPTLAPVVLVATVSSGAVINSPGVVAEAAGPDQAIDAASITGDAQVFEPTVEFGVASQDITGVTLSSGSLVFAPSTITVGDVTVVGATMTSGLLVRVPTVLPQPVTVTGATRPTTIQIFAPALTVGAVTVTSATVVTTVSLFPPSLTAVAFGDIGAATIGTSASVQAPTVVGGLATIGVPFLGGTNQRFTPTVIPQATITGATRPTTLQVFAPTVTVTAVTVLGATRPTTSQAFALTVAHLAPAVFVGTIGPASQVFVPLVAVDRFVTVGTIPVGSNMFLPTMAAAVALPPRLMTTQVFAMRVVNSTLTAGTVASTVVLRAPAVVTVFVWAGTCVRTSQIFAPTLEAALFGATIDATSIVWSPSAADAAEPLVASGTPFMWLM